MGSRRTYGPNGRPRKHFLPRCAVRIHFEDSDLIALKVLAKTLEKPLADLVRRAALDRLRHHLEVAKTRPDFQHLKAIHERGG